MLSCSLTSALQVSSASAGIGDSPRKKNESVYSSAKSAISTHLLWGFVESFGAINLSYKNLIARNLVVVHMDIKLRNKLSKSMENFRLL